MNLLVYASLKNNASKRLIDAISELASRENTEIFNSLDSLISRISKLGTERTIVVMLAATDEEVFAMLAFKDVFQGCRTILILPNREGNTTKVGYQLFPRFVSYADSDFMDVGAVLNKMIENRRYEEKRFGN